MSARSGIFAAAVTLGLGICTTGVAAQSLTDALISAYRNSRQLHSERAALKGTDEDVAKAYSARRPSINASVSVGNQHNFSPNPPLVPADAQFAIMALSMDLTLWDGGATDLGIKVARLGVGVARDNLVDTEQKVLLAAVTAFMDMRRDKKFLQLAENSYQVTSKQVQATRDRFEVGEVRRTDVSQVEARLALAQSIVALRQGTLEISREAYHLATGKYPGTLKAPPPPPRIPGSLAAAKALALKNHPAMKRAKKLVKIAELNVARAEAAMKLRVSLQSSVSVNARNSATDNAKISVIGSVPIYQGGALTSAVRRARALEEKARFDLQYTAQLVTQNVNRFWAQLQIAKATITARQKEVRSSRVALQGIREEASLGARTTLDVLDAERALFEAQTNLAGAKHDEYVAVYSLLSSMGLLTVKHLGLGIKTYDPDKNFNKVRTAPGPSNRAKLLEKILKRAGKG